jgi:RhtB (resistance to homoserine/threonine) family protein
MLGIHDLLLFVISGLLLNMAPGPDSLLIVSRSATQGWRAGSAAALGIGSGTCIHILAAAFGLSALLTASATAFTVVKIIGAGYLFYIGFSILLRKTKNERVEQAPSEESIPALSYWRIFRQGFLTNLLNPKVAVFFLAFVPQFISPDSAHKAIAFIVLGGIFNLNGMLWCHFLAVSTAFASRRFRVHTALARWIDKIIGVIFVSLGIKLVFAPRH